MNSKTYEPTTSKRVAFLGLGVMGYPMAAHLASGYSGVVPVENWDFGPAFVGAGAIRLVDHEDVGDLHHPRLHRLHGALLDLFNVLVCAFHFLQTK